MLNMWRHLAKLACQPGQVRLIFGNLELSVKVTTIDTVYYKREVTSQINQINDFINSNLVCLV